MMDSMLPDRPMFEKDLGGHPHSTAAIEILPVSLQALKLRRGIFIGDS